MILFGTTALFRPPPPSTVEDAPHIRIPLLRRSPFLLFTWRLA